MSEYLKGNIQEQIEMYENRIKALEECAKLTFESTTKTPGFFNFVADGGIKGERGISTLYRCEELIILYTEKIRQLKS